MVLVSEETCLIDDCGPMAVVVPDSLDGVRAAVLAAAETGEAIFPVGGRTMLALGLPPQRSGVVLDTRHLAGVIDYPARDMTITVHSGITMAQLQEVLASENQRLPLDVPQPHQATLGGALATNVSGPRRYGWGTLRDYVIGISTINDQGQEVKAGGRVVKNVAGYDLCKLHIGALGTLGIIAQVTLKVRPLPESQALITFACDQAQLGPLLDRVHASRTRPVCIDVLNRAAAQQANQQHAVNLPEAPWILVVGFEDGEAAVQWQMQQMMKELSPHGIRHLEARIDKAATPLWDALTGLTDGRWGEWSLKGNLLPSAVADFCVWAQQMAPRSLLQAHAGSGIVRLQTSGLGLQEAREMLPKLILRAQAAAGNVIVTRCPASWKRDLAIWGAPRSDLALMRQIKEKLDPRRLFNPGRFVGGL